MHQTRYRWRPRRRAAQLRPENGFETRFFDCDDSDAFVLARHGGSQEAHAHRLRRCCLLLTRERRSDQQECAAAESFDSTARVGFNDVYECRTYKEAVAE